MTLLRWSVCAVVASAFLACSSGALADGKVFSRARAIIEIPDQEALIHHAGGVQTLVIETRFVPPGRDDTPAAGAEAAPSFAWVVPVPGPRSDGGQGSVPEVFAVTTGLFPTLRAITAPTVESSVPPAWVLLTSIALVLIAVGGTAACRGLGRAVRLGLASLFVLCVLGVMLPALGRARSSSRGVVESGIELFQRSIVGSFDVAVVGADETDAAGAADRLLAWLAAEGHHVPPDAAPVVADYARAGWVFVAAKLRGESGTQASQLTPHPLGVRFRAREAVYPVRLTAVGDRPLKLDLYICADSQAVVPGMRTVRCAPIKVFPADSDNSPIWRSANADSIHVRHSGLRDLVGSAAVMTKLTATLSPSQMTSELGISWKIPRFSGGRKFSAAGAATTAANWASGVWLLAVVIGVIASIAGKWPSQRLARVWLGSFGASAAIGLVIALSLPTTATERGRIVPHRAYNLIHHAAMGIEHADGDLWTLETARSAFEQRLRAVVDEHNADREHPLPLPRREDSPFNYDVRVSETPGLFEVVLFDALGSESVVGLFLTCPPKPDPCGMRVPTGRGAARETLEDEADKAYP